MRRREFISLIGGAVALRPFRISAEALSKRPMVAFLAGGLKAANLLHWGRRRGRHWLGKEYHPPGGRCHRIQQF